MYSHARGPSKLQCRPAAKASLINKHVESMRMSVRGRHFGMHMRTWAHSSLGSIRTLL